MALSFNNNISKAANKTKAHIHATIKLKLTEMKMEDSQIV